ncbi:MAG: hypothetical protein ACRDSJ_01235 [Rubrobacteraceae bacterium]
MSPGVAIISAIVGLVTLVFAIFGASWLNQRATERFIEQSQLANAGLIEQLEKRFDALMSEFRSEIKRLDQRLDSVETRLDRIERQLEAVFKPDLLPRQP